MNDRILWTSQGFYVPAPLADTIQAAAEPAPAYSRPDDVLRAGMVGDFLGTPIHIIQPPVFAPPLRWWARAWRRLTWRRRSAS